MSKVTGKHMFEKFKELGLYSSDVGHVLTTNIRETENLLISAVGKVFYVFGCGRLSKYSMSQEHPSDITCLAASKKYIFTGCENVVRVFRNKQHVGLELHCEADIKCILPFGDQHVIAVDASNNLKIWLVETGTEFLHIPFGKDFDITCVIHPLTYTNKIVLGSSQGKLQLWNIKKNRLLHEYTLTNGEAVTCMEQSTTVDIIGVGTEAGRVSLLNLRTDKVLFELKQDFGPVRSMAFMLNNLPLLVTATSLGHICVWNLDDRTLKSVHKEAHRCPVAAVTAIRGQHVFVSNSSDNSIKMWVVDENNFTASLLRDRSGHFGSLSKVKFYDDERVLSAGLDSTVRLYSSMHENRNKSLGKANLMPPIVDFKFEKTRERHWDGMIAVHQRHLLATTWNVTHARIGSHKFLHDRFRDNKVLKKLKSAPVVSAAEVTSCGNFSLVGYSSGNVDVYNMQSGIYRGSLEMRKKGGESLPAHSASVVGVGMDSLNQIVVTVGEDKKIKFWSFKTRHLKACLKLEQLPLRAKLHRNSSMLAVVLQNFVVIVVDLDTQKVVRKFSGHSGAVTDLVWSHDGLMLITAGSDCFVRVWDLSLSCMVDSFSVESPVNSLSLSPNSALLATAHVNSSSISLWSNSSLYGLTTYQLEFDEEDEGFSEVTLFDRDDSQKESKEQLESNLLTQSGLPSSRWVNLSELDTIRQRNKPTQPVQKVTSAPFFLNMADANVEKDENKEVLPFRLFELSPFARALETKTQEEMTVHMKTLGPSATDAGLRSLGVDCGGSSDLMRKFLVFLRDSMATRKNFEIIQAYLHLFLKIHTEEIVKSAECVEVLHEISSLNKVIREEFTCMLDQSLTCANFIKTSLI